jgi:hypothetical protein
MPVIGTQQEIEKRTPSTFTMPFCSTGRGVLYVHGARMARKQALSLHFMLSRPTTLRYCGGIQTCQIPVGSIGELLPKPEVAKIRWDSYMNGGYWKVECA